MYLFDKIFISKVGELVDTRIPFVGVSIAPIAPGEVGSLKIGEKKIQFSMETIDFKSNGLKPKKEFLLYELADGIIKKINKWLLSLIIIAVLALTFYSYKFYEKSRNI